MSKPLAEGRAYDSCERRLKIWVVCTDLSSRLTVYFVGSGGQQQAALAWSPSTAKCEIS